MARRSPNQCQTVSFDHVLSLEHWLCTKLLKSSLQIQFPSIGVASFAQSLIQILKTISPFKNADEEQTELMINIVELSAQHGFTAVMIRKLPIGVACLLQRAIHTCQSINSRQWSQAACRLLGRTDPLGFIGKEAFSNAVPNVNIDVVNDIFESRSNESTEKTAAASNEPSVIKNQICARRFPTDLRLSEVQRLLDSSQPARLHLSAEVIYSFMRDVRRIILLFSLLSFL